MSAKTVQVTVTFEVSAEQWAEVYGVSPAAVSRDFRAWITSAAATASVPVRVLK